jgi:hypothetical protein
METRTFHSGLGPPSCNAILKKFIAIQRLIECLKSEA